MRVAMNTEPLSKIFFLSLNEDRISFTECEWKNNNKKHIEFPLHSTA